MKFEDAKEGQKVYIVGDVCPTPDWGKDNVVILEAIIERVTDKTIRVDRYIGGFPAVFGREREDHARQFELLSPTEAEAVEVAGKRLAERIERARDSIRINEAKIRTLEEWKAARS